MSPETRHPTPHSDINDLLSFWLEGVKTALGDKVIGAYLTGSLTYGDFVRRRSDIDLCVVVKQALSVTELESIKQLHVAPNNAFHFGPSVSNARTCLSV